MDVCINAHIYIYVCMHVYTWFVGISRFIIWLLRILVKSKSLVYFVVICVGEMVYWSFCVIWLLVNQRFLECFLAFYGTIVFVIFSLVQSHTLLFVMKVVITGGICYEKALSFVYSYVLRCFLWHCYNIIASWLHNVLQSIGIYILLLYSNFCFHLCPITICCLIF